MKTATKPKRGFLDGYKTYDPLKVGYGNPKEWKQTFRATMGLGEAEVILGKQKRTPWEILGVSLSATWEEIRTAFRKRSMETHPDRVQYTGKDVLKAAEEFKEVSAAYVKLADKFGK